MTFGKIGTKFTFINFIISFKRVIIRRFFHRPNVFVLSQNDNTNMFAILLCYNTLK